MSLATTSSAQISRSRYFSAGTAGVTQVDGESQFHFSLPGVSAQSDRIKDALWRPLSARPALVVPEDPGLVLARTPYARHLGALLLADDPRAWEIINLLEPPRVLAVEGCSGAPADADVEWLPRDPRGVAMHFAARARADHEA